MLIRPNMPNIFYGGFERMLTNIVHKTSVVVQYLHEDNEQDESRRG